MYCECIRDIQDPHKGRCFTCGKTIKEEPKVTMIDLTPTWSGILPMLCELLIKGNPTQHNEIYKEFQKMAAAADKWNEHCKNQEKKE